MTNRSVDVSIKGCCSPPETRLNQQIRNRSINEGCPVIDERGIVCGETDSLSIFKEFRKIYEECWNKLAANSDGGMLMKKLAPFRKIVEDLWQQNNMLVEAVEELEQEATCQVTNLQIKLDKSCQKEMHCMLKAKEREVQGLNKNLSEKDELIKNYCCQIESLKKDVKLKSKQCKDLLGQLKSAAKKDGNKSAEDVDDAEFDECDATALGELINRKMIDLENERNSMIMKVQNAEYQIHLLTAEKKKLSIENNEIRIKLKSAMAEKENLKNLAQKNVCDPETEGLIKLVDQLKCEKNELLKKMNVQNGNIQDLIKNFKEISLISGVAGKYDEIQELRKCLRASKDQLRQADKQIQFKDDIIKELRKELKSVRKSNSNPENSSQIPSRDHSPPTQLVNSKQTNVSASDKKLKDEDEVKLDIHIFSVNEVERNEKFPVGKTETNLRPVEVQTEFTDNLIPLKMRNVSTQHRTLVQKLPRSFGTLTVTPWSGQFEYIKETKKNLRGVYTVPFSTV